MKRVVVQRPFLILIDDWATHLLLPVIHVRDPIADERESGRVHDERLVADGRLEPRVVVIVQKATQDRGIVKRRGERGDHLAQGGHVPARRVESRFERKVDGVVEQAVHGFFLVGGDVGRVTFEDLTDGVDTGSVDEGGPEVLEWRQTFTHQPSFLSSTWNACTAHATLTFRTCLTVSILIASKP